MKIIFGVVGLVLGLLMGELVGGLIGLAAGIALATMIKKADEPAPPPRQATTSPPAPPMVPLEARVVRLEQEVAALRAEVKRLSPQAAAPAAAPIPEAAPVVLAVPAPPPPIAVPEPVLDTIDEIDTAPLPLSELPTPATSSAFKRADAPVPPRPAPAPQPRFEERMPPLLRQLVFGGNTIVKVGVLILFLGLAFLLRYAAERVTVPVELRYAGVALLGAVLLGLGWRLRERKDSYGLVLQGAGIGVFYLTTLAALKLSQLLPAELAFGFLFAVTLLSALLAVVQNAPWLAYVAAAEGFAAPVLVSTGSGNHIALFSYLAILDIGIFLMAWFRAWRPLNLIGAVGSFTLAGAWAHKHYTDALYPSTQAFLLFFFVLFTLVGVLFARRALALGGEPDARRPLSQRAAQALAQVGRVDSTLAFGVPLAAYGLQYLLVRDHAFGPAWAALGFSLFYLLLGGGLMRGGNPRYALLGEAYVIVSVVFGTLTIPLALEGQWTGATWAVEAAGMYWLGLRQHRRYARAFALLVLGAATLRLATSLGMNEQPGAPLLTGSVLGMLLLAASALAMFALARRAQADQQGDLQADWEAIGTVGQLWIGLAAVAALGWMLLTPQWACVASSALALGVLWLGLRWNHGAMVIGWAALQLGAGLGFAVFGPELWATMSARLTLWTPLTFTLAGLIAGDLLQRAAKPGRASAWLAAPVLHWAVVLWSLAWWTQVLLPDAYRLLLRTQKYWVLLWPSVLTGWVIATSVAVTALARWRDWRVLGQTAWATAPAWVLTAWLGVGALGHAPHAHWGWLVWPLALAWHGVLLRALRRWFPAQALAPLHVGGLWLFLLLAAREVQWWVAGWGEPGTAWPLLGWVLVPALVLAALARPRVLQRWPLSEFRGAYLVVACAPVALYLLLWLWVSNTQPGDPDPLPYVPLLNPLEIGHGLVLLALFAWHRALPSSVQLPHTAMRAGLGATAFALYTGLVLRTCHHWAGVPWETGALFDSTLTQAALSVAWAVVGVALMMLGHKRVQRAVWVVGAALLGVVVLKLFFVELADRGGLYRIVSFIVVGLLLLMVGYFAPVPPSREEARNA